MVNSRFAHLVGRRIFVHPFEGMYPIYEYTSRREAGIYLAGQAQTSGRIQTDRGMESFQPGDYLVSDDPVTHAWPVKHDSFFSVYTRAVEAAGAEAVVEPVKPVAKKPVRRRRRVKRVAKPKIADSSSMSALQ